MNKERVTYKVFPEQRVVVAEIHECRFDAHHIINQLACNVISSLHVSLLRDDERFLMDHYFKATARCHPEDEFDVEIGKKIALKKLTEAYHRSLNKHVANYMKYLVTITDNINSFLAKKHYKDGE